MPGTMRCCITGLRLTRRSEFKLKRTRGINMKSAQHVILILNFLFFVAISIGNFFYQKNGFAFPLKCVCSIGFVLMGLANVIYVWGRKDVDKSFCLLILTGFVLAMLGDIVIAFNFIAGAAVFALGHVFFLLSYRKLQKYGKVDICIGAVLFFCVACFLLFSPFLSFSSQVLKVVCVVYALIISTMFGKALGNFICLKNVYAAAMVVGSVLFFFSDLMLCLSKFSDSSIVTNHLCMGTYYPALCALAFSVYLYGSRVEIL